jgi:hypothetical protein
LRKQETLAQAATLRCEVRGAGSLVNVVKSLWSAWQAARVEVAQADEIAEQAAHPVEEKVVEPIVEKTEIDQASPDQPD